MGKKLELQSHQIPVLQKLAKVSKIDNWFNLDDDGVLRDRENGNKVMSVRKGCKQLMDGITPEDLELLDGSEIYTLMYFVANDLKTF